MSPQLLWFKNNIVAEWIRLWSVRSTWFFAACDVFGVIGISLLAGSELGGNAPTGASPWMIASFIGLPALFGCMVLFSITSTADYATKSIVPTLQWTPQRKLLLFARTTLTVLVATLFGMFLVTLAASIIWLHAQQLHFFSEQDASRLGLVAFVFGACTLLTLGLGLLTRNTATTLAVIFGLILVLPLLLQLLPFSWAMDIVDYLPGAGVIYFLIGEGPGDSSMNHTSATLLLLTWSVGVYALGVWRFLTDDANR